MFKQLIERTITEFKLHVDIVGRYAFYKCSELKYVDIRSYSTLSNSWILEGAFSKCEKLKEVKTNGVQLIGDKAFDGCTELEKIDLSDTKYIGNIAF